MADNFSDTASDSDSAIRRRPNKTVQPFSDYNESESSHDGSNDL